MGQDGGEIYLKLYFDEAIKVDKDMSSLGSNPKFWDKKDNHPPKKNKKIKLNKEEKEKELSEIENLQRMVKEITNTIIDFKKSTRESSRKPFKAWKKRKTILSLER